MAWDVEGTKNSLLRAGADEFGRFGLAGARVDRIAKRAEVNKERIYEYFGNKEALFNAVLERELAISSTGVEISGSGPTAMARYAGARFDHQLANPAFTRLLFWESLELETPASTVSRRDQARSLVTGARRAIPELSEADAQELLVTVITLVDGWIALRATDRQFTGSNATDFDRIRRRREFIVMTVESATKAALSIPTQSRSASDAT